MVLKPLTVSNYTSESKHISYYLSEETQMGLDMYAFKVRKLTEAEAASLTMTKLDDIPSVFNAFLVSDVKDRKHLIADLTPYLTTVRMIATFVNFKKIIEDAGVPNDAVLCGEHMSPSEVGFSFSWKNNGEHIDKSFTMSFSEYCEKYLYESDADFFVFARREIGCWRNYDALQEKLYDLYVGVIENCGFYSCNDDMIDEMVKSGVSEDSVSCNDEEGIFYHEWY